MALRWQDRRALRGSFGCIPLKFLAEIRLIVHFAHLSVSTCLEFIAQPTLSMNPSPEIDFDALLSGSQNPEVDPALESRAKIKALIENFYSPDGQSAEELIYWDDAARSPLCAGQAYFQSDSGNDIEGDLYRFGGKAYLQAKEGIFEEMPDSDERWVPNSDLAAKASIEKISAHDLGIEKARAWIAKEYSEGDPILEGILRMHLEYNRGRINPHSHDGILFFSVGQNASHQFYAGTCDGCRYTYSCCSDYETDEDGKPISKEEVGSVREVKHGVGWGYLGHL